jgi:hypothetical protein
VGYRSVLVGLLVAAAGCRGCRDTPTPPAPPTPKTQAPLSVDTPADTPVEAEESSILPPHVALAVHGSAKIELGPGWGWVIDASALDREAFLPDAGPTRPSRADAGGPSAAFSLQLSLADGTPVPLKTVSAAAPPSDPEFALEGETIAEARWLVAPESTQLAPGKYQLIATLEVPAVADAGWSGRTTSGPVRITIAAPPSPVTTDWAGHERLVKAHYAEAAGDVAGARAEIEALLKAQPENISALTVKGDLQEASNDKAGALKTFELALSILAKSGAETQEPPVYLLHRQRDLALALDKK